MTDDPRSQPEPLLKIPGVAADHLYREGSAKASFWEAIFGSRLRAKHRTQVSALRDGTRMFDVPLHDLEDTLLRRAQAFMASGAVETGERQAAGLIHTKRVRVKLLGLQPSGQAVADFSLRFEELGAPTETPAVANAFQSWFGAEGSIIARELLVPFGFTPR